jgi:hypothetical protein
MSVNEFIKNLAAAGFTGSFRASNDDAVFRGTINEDGSISKIKVQSIEQSRKFIKDMLYGNQTNKA